MNSDAETLTSLVLHAVISWQNISEGTHCEKISFMQNKSLYQGEKIHNRQKQ